MTFYTTENTVLRHKEQTVNVFNEIIAIPWDNHTKRKYKVQYNTKKMHNVLVPNTQQNA